MRHQTRSTKLKLGLVVGLALALAGCNADGSFGNNQGAIRLVLSRDGGSANVATSMATDVAASNKGDDNPGPGSWWFESATVTLSSILARTQDGVLINLDVDLPVAVDVVKIEGGKQVLLPDGLLPAAIYDQVVIVMTSVSGVTPDGTVVTIEPPGGGWTAVIPICPLDVIEGETATVAITLNVRNSFLRHGGRWSFQPRFRSLLDCADE